MKLLELFGGIGAFSKALRRLEIPFENVDYVEIDKYAVQSYNAINGTNFQPQDITKWNKNIEADIIMHGSPCQDFSVAGKQAGGDKDSGTRSSLLYETIRIVEQIKPKYVIWENVKNLISKKHKHNFDAYINEMERLGYRSYYKVLNAKDYGIPQNRERVFTISIRNDIETDFKFPEPMPLTKKLADLLEDEVNEKYYLSENMINYMYSDTNAGKYKRLQARQSCDRSIEKGIACTITTTAGQRPTDNFIKVKNATNQGYLEATAGDGMINNLRIRKLTPKECWRLMGFDDEDFDKAQASGISNTQLYKQAGNSIVVNVLEEIIKELFKGENKR